jgi:hypothetical protein
MRSYRELAAWYPLTAAPRPWPAIPDPYEGEHCIFAARRRRL